MTNEQRERVARRLYEVRFPHRSWPMASEPEKDIAFKQAEALLFAGWIKDHE